MENRSRNERDVQSLSHVLTVCQKIIWIEYIRIFPSKIILSFYEIKRYIYPNHWDSLEVSVPSDKPTISPLWQFEIQIFEIVLHCLSKVVACTHVVIAITTYIKDSNLVLHFIFLFDTLFLYCHLLTASMTQN